MILKKLVLKNIRSYKNQEIIFSPGSIILAGDIGAGKTSILLAIEFALFGLQPGQRGSSLLRNGEDSARVTLELEIDDVTVIIERGLKMGKKTVSQDYSSITLDGQTSEMSVTELKTKILKLLNYPAEFVKKTNLLYKYTVYSPQEEMKQIILDDPETRLNVLRHIFGIDKYKRIKENADIVSSRLKEKIRFLKANIDNLEEYRSDLEVKNAKILELESIIEKRFIELSEKILLRKSIESELLGLENKIKEKERFEKEIEKTNILKSNKRSQLADLEEESENLKKRLSENVLEFNKEELEETIQNIILKKTAIENLKNEEIHYQSKLNSINLKIKEDLEKKDRVFKIDFCPTCLQDVSEVHKHNIINDTEKSISSANKIINECQLQLQKISVEKNSLESNLDYSEKRKSLLEINRARLEEMEKFKKNAEDVEKKISSMREDIEFLEGHLNSLKSSAFEFSKFDSMYRKKEEDLKSAYKDEKIVEIEIASTKKEHEMISLENERISKKISEKEHLTKELHSLLDLESWISGDFSALLAFTEKNILFKLRQEFSRLFNKWFEMLAADSFYVSLDENFTPVIMQGEFELDYSFLSGGERTAIALAYRLALNETINSVFSQIKTKSLVILDEPTDGFSDQQLNKVRDVLQELSADQLIIVSHEQKIEGFVDNVIRLKKEHGICNVV
ncbi:hypothetical protein COU60_03275 [Candidatus Pacearchaeota archaeon CG10_big_fil_rev_8_21_14_0_10_34_76]|nr:MAG: hypothetical protein COU60_03275 [Candidatus Pacearchaeota archaeon CG10_big_fil_rev_8_21_14_0_10_34_76]